MAFLSQNGSFVLAVFTITLYPGFLAADLDPKMDMYKCGRSFMYAQDTEMYDTLY